MNKKIRFEQDPDGMKALAAYLAELVRQGVTYNIEQTGVVVWVELTGSF